MSLTIPQRGTPQPAVSAPNPDTLQMLPTDLTWLLEPEAQLDLLIRDMNQTPIRTRKISKRRALLKALRSK